MGYRLSLLDKSPLDEHEDAAGALKRTLELAQKAEQWGYHRFWLAEHHNTDKLAISSPEIVIAWILAHTRKLRVGSGGVMLQHYSPFKVAENFNQLASLAPGRVDLGVGKAPGGLPLSTHALQYAVNPELKGDFAEQLKLLDDWLSVPVREQSGDTLSVTPQPPQTASRFLLGASEESARLAARLGWNFVFAAHLNADERDISRALSAYTHDSSGRRALLAVPVIAADTSAQAKKWVDEGQLYRVIASDGQRVNVGSLEQAEAYIRQSKAASHKIEERKSAVLAGTGEEVHQQLEALQAQYGIEEFVIDSPVSQSQARLRSLELLASASVALA
ncbi:LLM class flavin-dependent oxidoreductase [Rouxiella badensis]|uniref:Alkane 1-monooxygenase n=1 Tax=Rouxiella badensis TaxID=1646377 RepID=A0A1X0WFF4_9GAMM|nr:LLM class flavin-dependent oxidoreductase [Rouxiella badensis]MCC3701774.1 LLM class flavin-dependent oxidoreductase [Rouxiella badensis]MCC3731416.1 LLM class flavin-dependent oxidoreductase [Rouxiella badensis]MCC3756805.1 LLM class flavin-dependent oxidoreductase [Rouxiella badensis]ORJ25517.1 alkane 1-monooxygenase [Rouxiella badensis]QII38489.1 LLM class flavin-dependent oxidoreductase [Rouxiella badensis]